MRESNSQGIAALLEQMVGDNVTTQGRSDLDVTGERFGCGARDSREKRACALYLWLLGPTTEQLGTTCPCRA